MKKSIKFAAVSTFVALMVSAAPAQTESASARTNVALLANIVLTGFKQTDGSNATPMRITNKDLLAALNASGHFTFGKNAQLILLSKDDQLPTASIRERTGVTATTTDISNFLTITQPGEVDGNKNLTSYSFRIFQFDDHNGTTLSFSGFTTLRRGAITSRGIGTLLRVRSATMQVSGGGTIGGANVILRGTINAGSPMAEVD